MRCCLGGDSVMERFGEERRLCSGEREGGRDGDVGN
jgi:hypothetical protein